MAKKIGLSPDEKQRQQRRDFEKELAAHWEKTNDKEKEILGTVVQALKDAGALAVDISYKDHPNKMQTGCYDVMYKDQYVGTMKKDIDGVTFTGNKEGINIETAVKAVGEC